MYYVVVSPVGKTSSTGNLRVNEYNCSSQLRKKEKVNLKLMSRKALDFPGDPVVKNLPVSAGDRGLTHGPERSHN